MLIVSGADAQNYILKNYTTRDGLPHNNIRSVALDSTGFLWLATWDGLSRFDGYEFRNYYHRVNDSMSLPFFSVTNLEVDASNNLWILTDHRQLVRYNRTSDNFSTILAIEGIETGQITNFCVDSKGIFWIMNKSEIFRQKSNTDSFKVLHLKNPDGSPFILNHAYNSVTLAAGNELWVAGHNVLRFTGKDDREYVLAAEYPIIRSPDFSQLDFDFTVNLWIYNSPGNNIWIFSNTGLLKYDSIDSVFREYRSVPPDGELKGKEYFTWGWRNGGIYIYHTTSGKLTFIPPDIANYPLSVLPYGNGSAWFSNTSSRGVAQGLSLYITIPGYFRNYMLSDEDSREPAVYSVIMDMDEKIWAGVRGYDHIIQIDSLGNYTKTGMLPEKMFRESAHVRSLLPDENGIWIGYYRGLLRFYNYSDKSFTDQFTDKPYTYRAIAKDFNNNIIIGSEDLYLLDRSSGKTSFLKEIPDVHSVFRLFRYRDSLILCTMNHNHVYEYNSLRGTGKLLRLSSGPSNVEDVIPGDGDELWFATLGDGVCRYNYSTGVTKFYTTSDGLSNNTTYCLLRDNKGVIWVTTNQGICSIHPETGRIRTFGYAEGLAISEFNSGAKFVTADGYFLFGGMGGIVKFHPDSVSGQGEREKGGKIILTDFRISGKTRILPVDLNEADTLLLEKGENHFRISFATSDLLRADKTFFRYMIPGLDDEWIETDHRNRNINYTNLRPGRYDMFIEATDIYGNWSARKVLKIIVRPYFWQTGLFAALLAFIVITIFYVIISLYIRNMRNRARHEQDELKLQALRGQMNPHFIFNSLNSINYFISNNDRLSANRYIADFSRLIRTILSNMGKDYVLLREETASLRDYLGIEHLRFGDRFDYEISMSGIREEDEIRIFPGLVQPFIENAIWHGVRALEKRKGRISVRFNAVDDMAVRCVIEDDGPGRKKAAMIGNKNGEHKSKGITIVSERLQIVSKLRNRVYRLEITDLYTDREDTGTRVEIEIPAKYGE